MPKPVIPGVNSSYQTDKMIEDLMKVERIPLVKKQDQVKAIEAEKSTWSSVNNQLSRLEESGKRLYGFENPFNEKIVTSADSSVVTAVAEREAEIQKFGIKVKQLASPDRLKTPPLPVNYEVPKGKYSFSVGKRELTFYFKGGSLKDFSGIINRKGKDTVRSSVVRVTGDTQVLMVESLQSGKGNILRFGDDARKLAIETGMISEGASGDGSEVLMRNRNIVHGKSELLDIPDLQEGKGTLTLRVRFGGSDDKDSGVTGGSATAANTEGAEDGAVIPISGSVTVEDVTVFQAPSDSDGMQGGAAESEAVIPDQTETEEALTSARELIVFNRISGAQPLENIIPGDETLTLEYNIDDIRDLQSISFNNIYADKEMIIESVVLDDGSGRDYTAVNPIGLAGNAILEMEGLEVIRDSNEIDDLVYGLTLNLKGVSSNEVEIEVESDLESIKNAIFDYVYNYNKTIESILVLTSSNPDIIDELTYLEDGEKEELREQLGTMKGDNTLNSLKTRMQTLTTSAWKGSPDSTIAMLSDLGISTNANSSGGFNPSRLRGYLEMDEKKLDEALTLHIDDVRNFFGIDTDDDLIIDNGLGWQMSNYIRPFTSTGGIIFTKVRMFDSQIKNIEEDILNLEDKLERKEQEYRVKFGKMEGMIEELQKNSQSLNGLNREGN